MLLQQLLDVRYCKWLGQIKKLREQNWHTFVKTAKNGKNGAPSYNHYQFCEYMGPQPSKHLALNTIRSWKARFSSVKTKLSVWNNWNHSNTRNLVKITSDNKKYSFHDFCISVIFGYLRWQLKVTHATGTALYMHILQWHLDNSCPTSWIKSNWICLSHNELVLY